MGIARAQVLLKNISGIEKDGFVNTFSFITPGAVDEAAGIAIAGALELAYQTEHNPANGALTGYLSPVISRTDPPVCKVYDASAGGSPRAVDTWGNLGPPAAANSLPEEVALVGSMNADLTNVLEEAGSIRPAARRRGRVYFGPFIASASQGVPARPSAGLRGAILDVLDYLADSAPLLTANGIQLAVHSRAGAQANPVVRVSVDDAWDTQRRRGAPATARTYRT